MKIVFTFCLVLALVNTLIANNMSISNMVLTGKNTGNHYTMVQFDISWENSWRTSTNESNWDAAWVFVKYRVAGGAWQHAWLNEDGHTAPVGCSITPGLLTPDATFNATTNPGLGAFIYRDANGTGTFTKTGVQLRWNYGANGVTDADMVEIKVFAIEMVYVPQCAFAVGSGGSEFFKFTLTTINTGIATTAPSGTGSLGGAAGGYPSGQTTPDNAHWPNGFNAFYCQKYEISQQQYVDFLNTLTQTQADKRKKTSSSCRYAITGSAAGSYATTNPYVACNYLNWMDGAAYSDWAGLRPMSELEFEKACRGPATPVANEYAWGNTTAIAANNITNPGTASETTGTEGANAVYGYQTNVICPMRVGVFAKASTTRVQSGASYYGIMELSGNLYERAVTVGNEAGRAFTGVHGNGVLSTSGNANVAAWPGLTNGEITGATGSGFRGGDWADDAMIMRASDRIHAAITDTLRTSFYGFRGVRTQPPFSCGVSTITINHQASGGVAPIDKTVTYGTVSTTLFGGTKCAITRNLGASQQASAATDDTEASAGWYWQFNQKQGYNIADDGTTRTPASFWVKALYNLPETWETAKDPCTLELGTGWRIPTITEWAFADTNGLWGNYTDTYNSVLKLHSAGWLYYENGELVQRGSVGSYWSNGQVGYGLYLYFTSGLSGVYPNLTSSGFSARCVKDLLPTVTTMAVTSITSTTASSGGNVADQGGSEVTVRGVCWSTTAGPTISLSTKTINGTGTGTYTSAITGLTAGTLYYVRAYATNSAGTSYGNEVSFTTLNCFIAGTKITMADGTLKNIEEIKAGEKVKSVKTETMEVVVETVEKTYANPPSADLTKISFSNGVTNTNTRVHPYWVVGKGWSCVDRVAFKDTKGFSAEPLAVGNQCLIVENGRLMPVTITNIEDQTSLALPTFNFTVSHTNCYFANGVLVHNKR
ncbi:MAG: SUMF1/EgtB/PvdO family nonheme iron enzyme [Bacteroidota bacterium]